MRSSRLLFELRRSSKHFCCVVLQYPPSKFALPSLRWREGMASYGTFTVSQEVGSHSFVSPSVSIVGHGLLPRVPILFPFFGFRHLQVFFIISKVLVAGAKIDKHKFAIIMRDSDVPRACVILASNVVHGAVVSWKAKRQRMPCTHCIWDRQFLSNSSPGEALRYSRPQLVGNYFASGAA